MGDVRDPFSRGTCELHHDVVVVLGEADQRRFDSFGPELVLGAPGDELGAGPSSPCVRLRPCPREGRELLRE